MHITHTIKIVLYIGVGGKGAESGGGGIGIRVCFKKLQKLRTISIYFDSGIGDSRRKRNREKKRARGNTVEKEQKKEIDRERIF